MAVQVPKEVKTAEREDAEQVIDTFMLAFAKDPIVRWLYPEPRDYRQHFPEFLRIFAGKAFDHGTAKYVEDFAGVALWLPPEVHPDDEKLAEYIMDTVPEERQEAALSAFEELDQYHPNEPHWHFAAIGIDPEAQRQGLATKLVEDALETCDERGEPVYLEATNTNSASLAVQKGFKMFDAVSEDTMPPFIPMVRRP